MPGLNRSARHGPGGLWRRKVQIVPGSWIGAHPLQRGNADADPIDLDASPLSPASSAVGRAAKPRRTERQALCSGAVLLCNTMAASTCPRPQWRQAM
jgi:hypothetical protein